MNTNDLLLRWSNMTLDQIEEEIRSGKEVESAVRLLGAETVAEVQALSFEPPGPPVEDGVVLLPGIMGSDLSSIRGVTTLVWVNPLLFVQGGGRYLALDTAGERDACPEVEIAPVGLAKICYLRMELALHRAGQLFQFPYDWRRPILHNAGVLRDSLERWAGGTARKFSLVAHSMGGLVSRAYMARFPEDAAKRVRRLVMLGTPNYGAPNAVDTLFGGNPLMHTVDGLNAANGMVDVVRNLPGVYNLLPAPPETFPAGRAYPAEWNLYHAPSWQVAGIRQDLLDGTSALHHALAKSDPQIPQVMVAGCNLETLVGVGLHGAEAHLSTGAPALLGERVGEGAGSGDGTVPLWSALLPGAETYYIQEKHGDLPANRQVIQSVLALLRGEACRLPVELPEPKKFLGLSFEVPAPVPTAPELEARIRSGSAGRDDLRGFYFAL
jgi:pimeloyl-ACP methyl ester carboxylesterase